MMNFFSFVSVGLLLPLTLALAACSGKSNASQNTDKEGLNRAIPVGTAKVEKRDVPIYLDGLGSVIAYKTVTVRPLVDGRLDKVLFKEGQTVKAGEVLAQIDPRPFQNELHRVQGQLNRDKAALDNSKRNMARYDTLAQDKLISAQQAEDERSAVAQGEALLQSDQAAVDAAKLNLDYARISSPIDGIAGIRNIDSGNVVHTADQMGIVTITQLDPIAIIFSLPQDAFGDVARFQAEGQREVIVFDREGVKELGRGRLEVIDNAINQATATLRLKAVLPNPGHTLWPNQFVKARLMLTVRKDALVIPAQAISRSPNGSIVYVVGGDHTVAAKPVTIDLLLGGDVLIGKGLSAGETVVTDGQNRLRPGSKVSPRQ